MWEVYGVAERRKKHVGNWTGIKYSESSLDSHPEMNEPKIRNDLLSLALAPLAW